MRDCRIADAMNTYSYALTVVKEKGYKIFLVPDARKGFLGDFWAIKEKRDFIASDPLRLLGLISIWERFGDDWYDKPKNLDSTIYDSVKDRALPDSIIDFNALSDEDFKNLVKDYQILFEAIDFNETKIDEDITREDLFDIINNYYKEDG